MGRGDRQQNNSDNIQIFTPRVILHLGCAPCLPFCSFRVENPPKDAAVMGPPGSHSPIAGVSTAGSRTPADTASPDSTQPGSGTDMVRRTRISPGQGRDWHSCAWHLLPLCCDTSAMMSPHPCGVVGISCSTDPIPCSTDPAALTPSPAAKHPSAAPSQQKPPCPLARTSPGGLVCLHLLPSLQTWKATAKLIICHIYLSSVFVGRMQGV